MRVFARSATNGQSIPVSVEQLATLLSLSQLLSRGLHIKPFSLGAAASGTSTVAEQGASDGCDILLHPEASSLNQLKRMRRILK